LLLVFDFRDLTQALLQLGSQGLGLELAEVWRLTVVSTTLFGEVSPDSFHLKLGFKRRLDALALVGPPCVHLEVALISRTHSRVILLNVRFPDDRPLQDLRLVKAFVASGIRVRRRSSIHLCISFKSWLPNWRLSLFTTSVLDAALNFKNQIFNIIRLVGRLLLVLDVEY